MNTNSQDFSYVLCPGSMPDAQHIQTYNQIFNCWHTVWSNTYAELKFDKKVFSDAFTRQDLVGGLFHKGTCFGIVCYRWADATQAEYGLDSYFSNWIPENVDKIRAEGDRVIICTGYSVHPYGRGQTLGVSGKDVLMGMVAATFYHSDANTLIAAVRADKGVDKACERWGAQILARSIPCDYNHTDLIGFYRDHMDRQPKNEISDLAEEIWSRRTVIGRQNIGAELILQTAAPAKVA